ncbi:uncharacterized protein TM35_000101610 [Trypanosoma theileri]|uniref:Uncharacterized protein n=1 Tax=Trypanosoma theileri TaxID=67003 RepID=A0A1X0NZI3_9TRYP|nr:uncharacterized protein TM35_000101610 [Trypanosoma theileri]ORC89893.1 hypothetical protein TM35_000101610 [Trypanosoma theileri]
MQNSFPMQGRPTTTITTTTPSLHSQITSLLQQQLAIEERLTAQRALMQRITEGFAVLREWAARSAHHDLSLHDLLLVATYNSEPHVHPDRIKCEGEGNPYTHNNNNINNVNNNNNGKSGEEDAALELMQDAKRAYRSFIRRRILDESSPQPDSPTQFHTLTADSFYILLPYLTELLRELLVGTDKSIHWQSEDAVADAGLIPSLSSLISTSSSTSSSSLAAAAARGDWCAALARVLRFLELGIKHFPDVMMCDNRQQCSSIMGSLTHLRESGISQSAGEAILLLRHRADVLEVNLQRLYQAHSGENSPVHALRV